MESRIKTEKKFKLSKKQLNYQNNLALITKLPSSTPPPNQAEHCPQCGMSDWNYREEVVPPGWYEVWVE